MFEYPIYHSNDNSACLICDDDTVLHDFECPDNTYDVPENLRQILHDIREHSINDECHSVTISVTDSDILFINVESWFIDNILNLNSRNCPWHSLTKDMLDGRCLSFNNFSFLWFNPDMPGSDESIIWLYDTFGYETIRFDNIVPTTIMNNFRDEDPYDYMAKFWQSMTQKYRMKIQ